MIDFEMLGDTKKSNWVRFYGDAEDREKMLEAEA